MFTFSFCLKSQHIRCTSETTNYTISENSLVFSGQISALNSSNKMWSAFSRHFIKYRTVQIAPKANSPSQKKKETKHRTSQTTTKRKLLIVSAPFQKRCVTREGQKLLPLPQAITAREGMLVGTAYKHWNSQGPLYVPATKTKYVKFSLNRCINCIQALQCSMSMHQKAFLLGYWKKQKNCS